MARMLALTVLIALTTLGLARSAVAADAAKPPEEPKDAVMGLYVGTYNPATSKAVAQLEADVINLGQGGYRAVLFLLTRNATGPLAELTGKAEGGKVTLAGKAGEVEWKGAIADGQLAAESKDGTVAAKLTEKKPPTLGMKPPAGAAVLIPFEEGKPPAMDEWANPAWVPMTDGSVLVAGGDNRTKRLFGDMKLHLEFRIPVEPEGKGQDRGNSGVYIQDLYEIQILDSFGLVPGPGDCGSVYQRTAPKANACLPPGQWQTYDITFLAPRFDADGKKVKDAVVTVVQNGTEVQKDQAIEGPTGQAKGRPEVKAAALRLQEHKHPVRFRNVWIVELKE